MSAQHFKPDPQRGFVLVTSIVLLMIITLLALGMFRGFATQEHIAGNLREKERAFHAAVSAEQYAEWWLLQPGNTSGGAVTCASGSTMSANNNQGQICNQTPFAAGYTVAQPSTWGFYVTYLPTGMGIVGGAAGTNNDPPYAATPAFYIADVGPSGDGQGEAYQIDAYSYGATTNTVAVVESVYELQQGLINRGGL